MEKQLFLTQARAFISDAELGKAIDLTEAFLLKDARYKLLYREALRLSSFHSKIKRDEEKGIVSFDNAKLSYNQLNDRLLNLLDYIEADNFEPDDLSPSGVRKMWTTYKWFSIAGLLIILTGLFFGVQFYLNGQEKCPAWPPGAIFKIMVLPFFNYDGGNYKPQGLIVERLENMSSKYNLSDSIAVKINDSYQPENLLDYDDAADRGRNCQSEMVIWGRTEKTLTGYSAKTRFQYLGMRDTALVVQKLKWKGENQIDTLQVLSSIVSKGDLTADLEEVILLLCGIVAKETGNTQSAIALMENVQTADSTGILVKNVVLGDSYLEVGEKQKALAAYDTLLNVHPNYWLARNNRGILRMEEGDYLGAIEDFSNVLEKREDADAVLARAKAFEKTEQFSKAKADYEKVVEMKPERKTEVGEPLERVNRAIEKEETVIRNITSSTTNRTPTKQELWKLSESLSKTGKNEAANQVLTKGISVAPQDPRFYAGKIVNLIKEGKKEEAAKLYRQVLSQGIEKEELFRWKPELKEYFDLKKKDR